MHVCRSLQEVIIRAAFADYHVIGVASKKNHDYLRKLGADRLYDYHDSTYLDEMAKDPKHKGLKVALDAIGKDTAEQCFAAFEKCGTGAGQGRVAAEGDAEAGAGKQAGLRAHKCAAVVHVPHLRGQGCAWRGHRYVCGLLLRTSGAGKRSCCCSARWPYQCHNHVHTWHSALRMHAMHAL